jgi:hypothetical protein
MIESAEAALLAITQRNVVEAQRQRNVTTLHEEDEHEHDHSPGDDYANQPTGSNLSTVEVT